MVQDHKYLMQYARVFAIGLIKCTDERDIADVQRPDPLGLQLLRVSVLGYGLVHGKDLHSGDPPISG
jgi:hypothetical protein